MGRSQNLNARPTKVNFIYTFFFVFGKVLVGCQSPGTICSLPGYAVAFSNKNLMFLSPADILAKKKMNIQSWQ